MSFLAKKKSGFQGQKQWPLKFHKKLGIPKPPPHIFRKYNRKYKICYKPCHAVHLDFVGPDHQGGLLSSQPVHKAHVLYLGPTYVINKDSAQGLFK